MEEMRIPTLTMRARRCLTLLVFAVWFGGFTFYAAVVVPVGTDLMGSLEQGFITRRVTITLNWIGVVAVVLIAWEQMARGRDAAPGLRSGWAMTAVLALSLLVLFGLHGLLDRRLDPDTMTVTADGFYRLHQTYLWCSIVQMLASIALCWNLSGDASAAGTPKRDGRRGK